MPQDTRRSVAPGESPGFSPGRGVRVELQCRELGSRSDLELREDVAEMEVDRPGAEEELRPDLAVGQALGYEARNLELLRSQARLRVRSARPRVLAAGPQLRTCTLRPLSGPEREKRLECRTQVLACVDASTVATEELAVGELGSCALERPRRRLVLAQCIRVERLALGRVGDERRLAVCDACSCPRDLCRLRKHLELLEPLLCELGPIRCDCGLDAVERCEHSHDRM